MRAKLRQFRINPSRETRQETPLGFLTETVDVLREISEKLPSVLKRLDEAVGKGWDVVAWIKHLAEHLQSPRADNGVAVLKSASSRKAAYLGPHS